MGAQNTRIWTARLWIGIAPTSAQNGGYVRGGSRQRIVTERVSRFAA
jgi:hypothetical protein